MIIRKEKFIFVDSSENHNKFWYIEQHDDNHIKTIWGRVGAKEQVAEKSFFSEKFANKEYERLVNSKAKKGYTKLNTIDIEITAGEKLSKTTLEQFALNDIDYNHDNSIITNMIKNFCNANIHNITTNSSISFNENANVFQTPCGIVTLETIHEARKILNKLFDLYKENKSMTFEFKAFADNYCRLIPQKIKGRKTAIQFFNDNNVYSTQESVLNSLTDSLNFINDMNKKITDKKDALPKLFNTSIEQVEDESIIKRITNLFNKTHSNHHACRNLKVKRIFKINIQSMTEAYNATKAAWKKENRKLHEKELWHGTRKTNIISIFKNGFVIPPSNANYCTGRMFGNYLYLSDQSTKSLNYAYGWWSGSRDTNCYMFLCDALMGNTYIPRGSCSTIPHGYNSIFAKAGISGVQNNEMVMPTTQVNPRYLIEFTD